MNSPSLRPLVPHLPRYCPRLSKMVMRCSASSDTYTLPSRSMAIDEGHIISPSSTPPVLNSPRYSSSTVHMVTRLLGNLDATSGPARLSTYITPSLLKATSTGLLNPRPCSEYRPMVWL